MQRSGDTKLMKYITSIWTCIAVLVIGMMIKVSDGYIVERLRLINFDSYQTLIPKHHDSEIVVINIGEQSLAEYGQWPWPRASFAQMISDIRTANAGLIAFTVMFPEADRFNQDEIFISWIKDNGIILSQTGSAKGRSDSAPFVGTVTLGNGDPYTFVDEYPGIVTNIPGIESVAQGIGVLNAKPEIDNVTRRVPLLIQSNNQLYPSLGMEILRAVADRKSYTLKVEPTGIENFRIPPYEPIITDQSGSVWIDWSKTFDTYEYGKDVLPDLKGKTVIIGLTAEGLVPLVSTPAGGLYPHDIQASILSNLMSSDTSISRPVWMPIAEITLILITAIVLLLCVYKLPIILAGAASIFLIGLNVGIPYYLWLDSYYLMDATFGFGLLILLFAHSSFNNFYVQFKLRQQIKKQFETYLDPRQVAALQKDPSLLKLGGERKEMTYLFMDIVGFTPISEYYKNKDDPEGLVLLVNEFLDAMTKIILNNGGMIDKFMGDCIMAIFNAPIDMHDHAEMAIKSAKEIEEKTIELKAKYKERGLPDINVGTGVNTGTAIIGNMGSETRFDYSVIGDAVNLGARLEATAARHEYIDYKTIWSSMTQAQLPYSVKSKCIGDIKVKGKEELIKIYTFDV